MMAVSSSSRDSRLSGGGGSAGADAGKYVRYTPEQVEALERLYNECPKPSSLRRQQLIRECPILSNIEPKQIKVWFQNRRCREKQRNESSRLQSVNKKLNAMNKLLMEENDRLQKQVAHLVYENSYFRQQTQNVAALATTDTSCESVVTSGQQNSTSQRPLRDASPAGLVSIAEETLAEFLSKATGTAIEWIQLPGMKPGPDSIGIIAISHGCSGIAARACGLVSLEPARIAEILKDWPSWYRDCRAVDVMNVLSSGNGGTIELLYMQHYALTTLASARDFWLLRYTSVMEDGSIVICERSLNNTQNGPSIPPAHNFVRAEMLPSGYLIRPCEEGGSIIHIVDHFDLEPSSVPEVLRPLYESSTLLAHRTTMAALRQLRQITLEVSQPNVSGWGRRPAALRALAQRMSKGFNEAVNGFADEGWSVMESDGIDDVTILVNSSPMKILGPNVCYVNGFSSMTSGVLCARASMLLQNVPPAILLRFLREHRSEWADSSIDAYAAAAIKAAPCNLPGIHTGNFGGQIILPLAHTIENEEFMEVVRLENIGYREDMYAPGDIFMLQLCNGVDESASGSCAELIFAPIDASFSDDAPLLPSGFRRNQNMSIHPAESMADRMQKFVRFEDEHRREERNGEKRWIIDPQGSFLQKWNKIFLIACVLSVAIDPLFFYIPVIDDKRKCLDLDNKLKIIASVLRTLADLFYALRIILQFRTGFISPPTRVMGRGELIKDPLSIATRYISSYFWIDVLSVVPLPQLVVLLVVRRSDNPIPKATKHFLKIVIFSQYVPRLIRISTLYKQVTHNSGIITETAWAGAAFNLFLYIIASHVVGAFWYLFAIERQNKCWHNQCDLLGLACHSELLYCTEDTTTQQNITFPTCILKNPDDILNDHRYFNYGIFYPALSTVVKSRNFIPKFLYCFWWGLRNLSSLGQNLQTSPYFGENLFCVFICVAGLVLFALLIGNMQKYLESTTVRVEEMRVRKRDAEKWMSHRLLPESLRDRIRKYEQYKWQETRGVDEESLIRNLPKDIKRDIKRHLCLSLLMRVPMFKKMDEHLLDAMCNRLKPAIYMADSSIVREGDPVDEMLFIMRGKLKSTTTNGGRTGFFNSAHLEEGDFCGEALLTWALDPFSSPNLPISTMTVMTITEVEALALLPDDFKFVASQFRRLNSKQIRHTFRFCSQQWRTWAACFIQAAWRQHYRKKQIEKAQRDREEKLQEALAKEGGNSLSFGATIYASRFAANVLKNTRRNSASKPRPFQSLPSLVNLQKPAEPDFSI